MALFGNKKKTETKKETKAVEKAAAPVVSTGARDLSHVLSHARITEKASLVQGSGIYVFDIPSDVSKRDIMQAVKQFYGVTPRKINVTGVKSKEKRSMRTGRVGIKKGGRKAYIYLKSGETITL